MSWNTHGKDSCCYQAIARFIMRRRGHLRNGDIATMTDVSVAGLFLYRYLDWARSNHARANFLRRVPLNLDDVGSAL